MAHELDLGDCILLSDGEARSGGRDKKTILADACEALLGAVFVDAGFETARAVVRALLGRISGELPRPPRDAKIGAAGMGARPRACRCRATSRWSARGPTMRRASLPRCAING